VPPSARARGLNVVEVNQPDRHRRRRRGKSDRIDAEMAARTVLAGNATALPKAGDGPVEALRQLRLARSGAMKARTAAANQLHNVCDTAPDPIRRSQGAVAAPAPCRQVDAAGPGRAFRMSVQTFV
jgi:transposase